MFTKYKKIIIGVLVLILGFVAYSIFIKSDPEPEELLKNSSPKQIDAVGQEIIRTLSKIKSLDLDQSVFGDPIYLRLIDDTKDIPEPEVGRSNPFEPFSVEGIGTNSETEQDDTEEGSNNTEQDDTEEGSNNIEQ